MKTIMNVLYEFFVSMGKAKAASALARMGDYESAKHIMTGK